MHSHTRQNTTFTGLSGGQEALFAAPHRFSFNGKESDSEVKGEGNSLDFGARVYDSRLGRFLSRDPKESKYVSWSTYTAFLDNPIIVTDPTGKGGEISISYDKKGNPTITVTSVIYVYSEVPAIANDIVNYAATIQQNINDTWNQPNFSMLLNGREAKVVFNVSVIPVKSPEEAKKEIAKHRGDAKYNYIHLNETVESSGEPYNRTTGNVGSWSVCPEHTNTYAHEYGHLLANRLTETNDEPPLPTWEENGTDDHPAVGPSIFYNSNQMPTQVDLRSLNFGLGILADGGRIKSIYGIKASFSSDRSKLIGELNIDKVYNNSTEAILSINSIVEGKKNDDGKQKK